MIRWYPLGDDTYASVLPNGLLMRYMHRSICFVPNVGVADLGNGLYQVVPRPSSVSADDPNCVSCIYSRTAGTEPCPIHSPL